MEGLDLRGPRRPLFFGQPAAPCYLLVGFLRRQRLLAVGPDSCCNWTVCRLLEHKPVRAIVSFHPRPLVPIQSQQVGCQAVPLLFGRKWVAGAGLPPTDRRRRLHYFKMRYCLQVSASPRFVPITPTVLCNGCSGEYRAHSWSAEGKCWWDLQHRP
jgi:hypothetical protein